MSTLSLSDPNRQAPKQGYHDLQRQIDRNSMSVDQLVEATTRLQESVDQLVQYMHESHNVSADINALKRGLQSTDTRVTTIETRIKTQLAVWGAVVTAAMGAVQIGLRFAGI